ncbi:hypothetical protein PInf_003940 [Phytophthora infestans]|nr:hypothetical protein PInf_003940 [Phytophthora infestans]
MVPPDLVVGTVSPLDPVAITVDPPFEVFPVSNDLEPVSVELDQRSVELYEPSNRVSDTLGVVVVVVAVLLVVVTADEILELCTVLLVTLDVNPDGRLIFARSTRRGDGDEPGDCCVDSGLDWAFWVYEERAYVTLWVVTRLYNVRMVRTTVELANVRLEVE